MGVMVGCESMGQGGGWRVPALARYGRACTSECRAPRPRAQRPPPKPNMAGCSKPGQGLWLPGMRWGGRNRANYTIRYLAPRVNPASRLRPGHTHTWSAGDQAGEGSCASSSQSDMQSRALLLMQQRSRAAGQDLCRLCAGAVDAGQPAQLPPEPESSEPQSSRLELSPMPSQSLSFMSGARASRLEAAIPWDPVGAGAQRAQWRCRPCQGCLMLGVEWAMGERVPVGAGEKGGSVGQGRSAQRRCRGTASSHQGV